MSSLFTRIFLWFWGAMLLIMVATSATIVGIAWQRFSNMGTFDAAEATQGARAALLRGGRTGLEGWLRQRTGKGDGVAVYAIDRSGRDILGRDVPLQIRSASSPWQSYPKSEAPPSGKPAFMERRSHVLLSVLLRVPGQEPWWLAGAWAGSTANDVLGSPGVWGALIVLALILSVTVCWFLARGISRPIVRLQLHARHVADGDFGAAIDPALAVRRDEVGQLAREFDQMSTQIQEQLVSKEMLLRDISHEFRSPLTRLRVAAGLARVKAEKVDDYLERIERDIERLDRLIDDTLRFSMVGTPGLTLPVEAEDLAALVGEAVHDAEIEAQDKGIDLLWQQSETISLRINLDLMYRAVDNVIRNAIRHSPPKGAVKVAVSTDGDFARIVVEDEGPGVPAADLERIFEAFYRVSKARERQTGGAGLGLALTSRVATLHGGCVLARNRLPQGLCVIITLPVGNFTL